MLCNTNNSTSVICLHTNEWSKCYILICIYIYIYMQHHNDTINNDERQTSLKKYTSHFIAKVRKGLLKVFLWEGAGDRTELQYIDPHSYGHQRCVFLVLQCCSTGGPGAQLSAERWLSLPYLVSDFSGPQLHRGSQGPLRPGVAFPTTSHLYHIWFPTLLTSNSIRGPEGPFSLVWLSLPHLVFNSWLPVFTELYNSSIAHSIFGMACLIVIKGK